MLSAESAALVRATLPAVAEALDEITTRFYATMFHDRPELLDGMFNRGNQAGGAQRRALAGSIAGFASALLENPGARPDALLSRIAHKHATVGVTDDQYTIVHKQLFGAIAEVLGNAVTPEVAAAWDEETLAYARTKIDAVVGRPGLPEVTGEVHIVRAPARHAAHPWSATADLRIGGRQMVAAAEEATGTEVVDRLQDRLRRQTDKAARSWDDGHRTTAPPWRGGGDAKDARTA